MEGAQTNPHGAPDFAAHPQHIGIELSRFFCFSHLGRGGRVSLEHHVNPHKLQHVLRRKLGVGAVWHASWRSVRANPQGPPTLAAWRNTLSVNAGSSPAHFGTSLPRRIHRTLLVVQVEFNEGHVHPKGGEEVRPTTMGRHKPKCLQVDVVLKRLGSSEGPSIVLHPSRRVLSQATSGSADSEICQTSECAAPQQHIPSGEIESQAPR